MRRLIALLAVFAAFAFASAALAESALMQSATSTKEPIDIKADSTEFRGKENLVLFLGSVTAARGEMTITSDRLEVVLNPQTREVTETRAVGNVSIRRADVLATGGKAVYLLSADTVTLTDGPKIWRGGDAVEGETVILHLGEDRMEVKGQARVILNPQNRKKEEGR